MKPDRVNVDEQIDDWKGSQEFENLLHGNELLADFDKSVKSIFTHMDKLERDNEA